MAPTRWCQYINCPNTNRTHSLFRFPPNDENRLQIWIKNSGNINLKTMTPGQLKNQHLCEVHFEPCYKHQKVQHARLTRTAIPRHYRGDDESIDINSSLPLECPMQGNMKIKHLAQNALRNKYICIDHFKQQYIQNESGKRIRLNKLAVPKHYQGHESTETSAGSPIASTSQDAEDSKGPKQALHNKYHLRKAVPIPNVDSSSNTVSNSLEIKSQDFHKINANEDNRRKLGSADRRRLCQDSVPQSLYCTTNELGKLEIQTEEDHECPDLKVQKPNKIYHNYYKQICADLTKDSSHNVRRLVGNKCTDCENSIYGFLWWCVQCPGARCGKCALRMPHRPHYLLRAPAHSTREQTEAMLAAIRQQIGGDISHEKDIRHVDEKGVDLVITYEPEVKVEPEVKSEPPEVNDEPLDPLAECKEEGPFADFKPVVMDTLASSKDHSPLEDQISIDYKESGSIDAQSRFDPEYKPLAVEICSPVHPGLDIYELSLAHCSGIKDFTCTDRLGDDSHSITQSENRSQTHQLSEQERSIQRARGLTHYRYTGDNSNDNIEEIDYEQPSHSRVESDTEQDETKRPWVQVVSSQKQYNTVSVIQKPKTPKHQNILAKEQNVQTKRPWVQVFSNKKQKSTDTAKQKRRNRSHIEGSQEQTSTLTEKQYDNNAIQPSEIQHSKQGEQFSTDSTKDMYEDQSSTVTAKRKKKIIKKRSRTQYATHIQRDFKELTKKDGVDKNVQCVKETEAIDIDVTTEPTNTLLNLEDYIREKVMEYPSDIEECT